MKLKKKLRKWYYYQAGAEKMPKWIRYLWQKRKSDEEKGIVLRNGNWVTKSSRNYHFQIQRTHSKRVHSEKISCIRTDYSYMTLRKNCFLDMISKKHTYTWNDMLVVTDPYNKSPLTALLIFYTPFPAKVCYTVIGTKLEHSFSLESSFCQEHKVAVFGLYPGKRNQIHLSLIDEQQKVCKEKDIFIRTEELPETMQDLIKVRKKSELSACPMIMITGGHEVKTCAFDSDGQIRFYLSKKAKAYGIFPTEPGRFLFTEKYVSIPSYLIPQGAQYYDMDYLGGSRRTYFTRNGIHHCARQLPNGNYIMGSSSFFGSVENVIVEVSAQTGKPVKTLVMDDLFDDYYQNWKDWAHVNAVDYRESDHSVLISLRNVHAVIKVDWETFELQWILSNPAFWEQTGMRDKVLEPVGEVTWFYQQHAACFQEEDEEEGGTRILLYDNHWDKRRKAECFDGDEEFSYISVFCIDEEKKQVSMQDTTRIAKSTIRSNALGKEEYNRLFAMSGNLLQPVREYQGLIEEMNYETKEIINSYLVKYGFFAACEFAPRADVLEIEDVRWQEQLMLAQDSNLSDNQIQPKLYEDYMVGETLTIEPLLQVPQEFASAESCDETASFWCNEDVLFVKAKDHAVKCIYLQNETNAYKVDFVEAIEEKKVDLVDNVYAVPIWLKDLPNGKYHLYVQWEKSLQVIEEAFILSDATFTQEV